MAVDDDPMLNIDRIDQIADYLPLHGLIEIALEHHEQIVIRIRRVIPPRARAKEDDPAQAFAVMPMQGGDHLIENFALFGFVGHA